MMTQEEIDAILDGDEGGSVEMEVTPLTEDDDPMEGDVFDIVKGLTSAIMYLKHKKLCNELLEEYVKAPSGSYSAKLSAYRIVVAALTSNEKRNLTEGERWFPIVQFCKPGKESNCLGKKIIGRIQSEGEDYVVVGGGVTEGSSAAGLGIFFSDGGVSHLNAHVGFRSVSSERVAKYISEQFGRLLFEILYGGLNCDWKWLS